MYVLALLVLLSKVYGFFSLSCNGTIFRDQYYDTQSMFLQFGRAYHMVMHESSGSLFFSHGSEYLNRRIVGCNTEKGSCWNVTDARRGFTVAYNRAMDYVYFGGNDGIYEYNVTANTAKFIGARKIIIWCIFVTKNNLFYIDYPSRHLYRIVDKENSVKVGNKQYDYYFISKHLVHYYTNKIGELYKIEKPATFSKEAVLLNHKLTVRQITQDIYGVVYFCAKEGIYIENEPFRMVTKIVEFGDLYAVVVINKLSHVKVPDEFIIIYSNGTGIYKFYPSPYAKYCSNKTSLGAVRMATTKSTARNWVSFSVKFDYD